jgi:LmeA-like phospholipid-binding
VIGGILFLLLLLVAAYVVAEILIRDYATDRVKTQVAQGLALESEDDVGVSFAGSMVLHAIRGSIGQADVTVDDATFGPLTGDLDIRAEGVPLDSSQPVEQLGITMTVTEENVAELGDYLTGVEVADISLAAPEILVETEFSLLGIAVPAALGLEPEAVEGALGFTPSSIEVGGRRLTADELRSSEFGGVAQPLLEQREVCIAEYLPEALVLQDVDVVGNELVAAFTGASVVLSEAELTALGSCA